MVEIINNLLSYSGLNAKQFAERIGLERPQAIYDIQKGKTKTISPGMANKILSAFPAINRAWLLSGEGQMLRKGISIGPGNSGVILNGANNNSIDNRHYYSDSPDVLKAQIEILEQRIKEKDAQIKEKDAQIKEKDAQIKEKDAQIKEKDAQIKEKDAQIKEKDAQIQKLLDILAKQ